MKTKHLQTLLVALLFLIFAQPAMAWTPTEKYGDWFIDFQIDKAFNFTEGGGTSKSKGNYTFQAYPNTIAFAVMSWNNAKNSKNDYVLDDMQITIENIATKETYYLGNFDFMPNPQSGSQSYEKDFKEGVYNTNAEWSVFPDGNTARFLQKRYDTGHLSGCHFSYFNYEYTDKLRDFLVRADGDIQVIAKYSWGRSDDVAGEHTRTFIPGSTKPLVGAIPVPSISNAKINPNEDATNNVFSFDYTNGNGANSVDFVIKENGKSISNSSGLEIADNYSKEIDKALNGSHLDQQKYGVVGRFSKKYTLSHAHYEYIGIRERYIYGNYSAETKFPMIKQAYNFAAAGREDGTIRVTWNIATSPSGADKSDFEIQRAENADFTRNVETFSPVNGYDDLKFAASKTSYSFIDEPESREDGIVTYYYRIRRKNLAFDSPDIKTSIEYNTDYKRIASFIVNPIEGTTTAKVSWTLTSGMWNEKELAYELVGDNGFVSVTPEINSLEAIVNLKACIPYNVTLKLRKGGTMILNEKTASIMLPSNVEGTVTKYSTSTGLYPDRVALQWHIHEEQNNFSYFIVSRLDINDKSGVFTQLDKVEYAPGTRVCKYEDMNAIPGVFYTYKVDGYQVCDDNIDVVSDNQKIGFSQPYGTVTGRITYKGNVALKDACILVEGEEDSKGKSLAFSPISKSQVKVNLEGTSDVFDDASGAFQVWMRTLSTDKQIIFAQENGSELYFDNHNLHYSIYPTAPSVKIDLNSIQKYSVNAYNQYSLTYERTTLLGDEYKVCIYVNNILAVSETMTLDKSILADMAKNKLPMYLGSSQTKENVLDGNLDEIRFWSVAISASDISKNFDAYLNGKEKGLTLYYRCDEPIENNAFDISGSKANYNEHHADLYNVLRDVVNVPSGEQLALKTYTDRSGNYIINNIPYTGDGAMYTITPMFGVHEFDPISRPLFFNPAASTHNGIDFVDISAFEVSGTVSYVGGTYPVADCFFFIDGMQQVDGEGMAVATNADGQFTLSVPIGEHSVQVRKHKHVFTDNGYLLNSKGKNLNYQDKIVGVEFKDETTVKVIGKVVGGVKENAYPVGFGLSKNNIEEVKITFIAEKDNFALRTAASDTVIKQPHYDQTSSTENKNNNTQTNKNGNTIEVKTSTVTGEYVAYLPPETFIVEGVRVGGENQLKSSALLDIKANVENQYFTHVHGDSIEAEVEENERPHMEWVEKTDSVMYNAHYSYEYRVAPSFSISEIDKSGMPKEHNDKPYRGSLFDEYINTSTQELDTLWFVNEEGTYTLGSPVYDQGYIYQMKVEAAEVYTKTNEEGEIVEDHVPVSDANLVVNNQLKVEKSTTETLALDSLGTLTYSFQAGAPDLTTGVKLFSAALDVQGRVFDYEGNFSAYGLGAKSTGNNFTTAGPSKILFVLRDPPGSGSSVSIEDGSTVTVSSSTTVGGGASQTVGNETELGASVTTWVGVGAGTIIESEVTATVSGSISMNQSGSDGTGTEEAYTLTSSYSTSDDPDWVGADADVFVGHSTNIVYGATNTLAAVPLKDSAKLDKILIETDDMILGYGKSMAIGTSFATDFAYTLRFIRDKFIPDLQMLRDKILLPPGTSITENTPGYADARIFYVSKLDKNDPNFGASNIDNEVWGDKIGPSDDGPSYKIYASEAALSKKDQTIDSVLYYNEQVAQWEQVLADNEKQKIQSETKVNRSFTAGANVEETKTTSKTTSTTSTFEFVYSSEIGSEFGFEIMGVGSNGSVEISSDITRSDEWGEEKNSERTYSYALAEDGDDALTVDIAEAEDGSYVFRTRAGQTSCPYEDAIITEYYKPGTVISEATMKIEVPKIRVTNPVVTGIPSNRPAVFTVELTNESETEFDMYYGFYVGNNPDGAIVKVDGKAMTGDNSIIEIMIPYGEVVRKTVTIEKGPLVDRHENIRLGFGSLCQNDPTDAWDDIEDFADISAYFIANCSNITLVKPDNNWTMNLEVGNSIQVQVADFDINTPKFGYVDVQYKGSSSSRWITAKRYFKEVNDAYNNYSADKGLIDADNPTIKYTLILPNIDQTYDIQATVYCVETNGDVSAETPTDIASGIRDMYAPRLFGQLEPADGILGLNDVVSIQFNEPINAGMVTFNNFKVQGVRNGRTLQHNSAVQFDGAGFYAETEHPIALGNDFTIEAWVKRSDLNKGTLINLGGNAGLSLRFNAANNLELKMANETLTTTQTYMSTGEWMHVAITYSTERNKVQLIVNDYLAISNDAIEFPSNNKLRLGSVNTGTDFVNAEMHALRLWNRSRSHSETVQTMNLSLSGSEVGLVGCWNMDESYGKIAKDKSRNRHLKLNAEWSVNPKGYAVDVTAPASFLEVNTSTSALFGEEDNFSLEFLFKGEPQTDVALFSCGKGDGLDSDGVNKMSIFVDNKGYLRIATKEKVHTISKNNVLDGMWNHIVVSVNRSGNASVYLNGDALYSVPNTEFGGIINDKMLFGKRAWKENIGGTLVDMEDMYFSGFFDEVRFWNQALEKEIIKNRQTTRLSGEEVGLVAYYPFDKYITQSGIKELVYSDINSVVGIANPSVANIVNGGETQNSAPVKGVVEKDNLSYDYVVNDDKIIITLNEATERIAGIDVFVAVSDITDLNGNKTLNDYEWMAYVNNKTLVWDNTLLEESTLFGEALTFTMSFTNITGKEKTFSIEELPSYMQAYPQTGSVLAMANQKITFTVDANVNIGSYREVIRLVDNDNIGDCLTLALAINAEKPDWSFDQSQYEYNMNVVAQIRKEGKIVGNTSDIIAAFIGGECVGVTSPKLVSEMDKHLVFSTVYGLNSFVNHPVQFKYWESMTGNVYEVSLKEDIYFITNKVNGTPANPIEFEITNSVEQVIDLKEGWNWMSMYVNPNHSTTGDIFGSDDVHKLAEIKSQTQFMRYDKDAGILVGTLDGLNHESMYMVDMNESHKLNIAGKSLTEEDLTVDVNIGWNWLGYPLMKTQSVGDALAGYNANANAIIKSQTQFAIYDPVIGWVGSLEYLVPSSGYKLSSLISSTFNYSNVVQAQRSRPIVQKTSENTKWTVDYAKYQYNMTVIAGLYDEYGNKIEKDIQIGFFVNGECRGTAISQTIEGYEGTYFFAVIYSNLIGSESGTVKIYDMETGLEFKSSTIFAFNADDNLGTVTEPMKIQYAPIDASTDDVFGTGIALELYPNPASDMINLTSASMMNKVEIYSVDGELLMSQVANTKVLSLNIESLSIGCYMVKIYTNDGLEHTKKLIKL